MKKILSVLILVLTAASSFADLESMRARIPDVVKMKDLGLIGEQADGFLGVVSDKEGAASVVAAENADRKEEYSKRAASQGQTAEVFGAVIGSAKVRDEKPGRFVKDAAGQWKKK
jgi:uncharacterized protein YdbL (DUF1318 family)